MAITSTRAFRTWLVILLAMIAPALAQAAAFRMAYDPQFTIDPTSAYFNLGFRGDGILDVPEGCLANEGVVACPSASFDSLDVDLYNYIDNIGNPNPTILQTVSFVPPLDPQVSFVGVDLQVSGGMVVGVSTPIFGYVVSPAITGGTANPDPLPLPGPYHLWLDFDINPVFNDLTGQVTLQSFAYLLIGDNCDQDDSTCSKSLPATVRFERVSAQEAPEPAPITLILSGLGLLAVFARTRHNWLSH